MDDALKKSFLDDLVSKILSWTAIQRCALFCVLTFAVTCQYCIWSIWAYYWPPAYDYINRDVIVDNLPYAMFFPIGLIGLYLICHYFSETKNTVIQFVLQLSVALFYVIDMWFFGYLIGSVSIAVGVVLMGASVFGLMLIDRRVVYIALLVGGTIFLVINLMSLYGTLPYAPLLSHADKSGMFGSAFWFGSMLFFLLPYLLGLIGLSDILMTGLRQREAEIRYLSEHDPLTGLYNRRSLNARVEQRIKDADMAHQQLAVLLLDLDYFKQINDTHGHLSGDQVLIATAQVIESQVRQSDLVGRFGGEEFILVLHHTTVIEATQIAERIRQRLMALQMYSEDGIRITVQGSLGVICVPIEHETSWRELVHHADEALYKAKQWGRNQVVVYQDYRLTTAEHVLR